MKLSNGIIRSRSTVGESYFWYETWSQSSDVTGVMAAKWSHTKKCLAIKSETCGWYLV